MNTQLINPKQFNTVEEFKTAMNLNIDGEWMDVARHLGVELDPKGGRRSIYKAWQNQNASTATTKQSVATKINVVQTSPVAPERADFATEDEYDIAWNNYEISKMTHNAHVNMHKNDAPATVITEVQKPEAATVVVADVQPEVKRYFRYGMRLRPLGIGCQPVGHVEYEETDKSTTGFYGVVSYLQPLMPKSIEQYELTDLQAIVQPEVKLPKAPRRIDYPKGEEGEDQFDADMTAWVMLKQQLAEQAGEVAAIPQPEVQPAEVVTVVDEPAAVVVEKPAPKKAKSVVPVVAVPQTIVTDISQAGDNIDETALQLAKLLRSIKPEVKTEANPNDIARMIQDAVSEESQELRENIRIVDMQLSTAMVELQKQIQSGVQTIEVKVNDKAGVKVDGLVHERFEDILRHVSVRDNVMLVGPAGSGKTTVCENVAQALGLDFYCKSVCAQTSKAELLGYMDANGNFVSTEFRVAYQNGGVFVLDEIDAGNPNVIAVLNSALANNYCAFADGMIRKHEDFVLIACANTYGTGASREYVGRNQLDSATLDRFSVVEFNYDLKLEKALSSDKTFCKFVQNVRKELASERVVISPRASIQGGKLLAAGCTPEYVMQTRILKGMAVNLAERVKLVFEQFYPGALTQPVTQEQAVAA